MLTNSSFINKANKLNKLFCMYTYNFRLRCPFFRYCHYFNLFKKWKYWI